MICICHQILSGDKIKEDDMVGYRARMGEKCVQSFGGET
jgi:hypothetical protein